MGIDPFLEVTVSIFGQTTPPDLIRRDVHFQGQKHQKQQHNNHNFECLYSMLTNLQICVVVRCSVRHIGGWNCPEFMHKSKYNETLYHHVSIALHK